MGFKSASYLNGEATVRCKEERLITTTLPQANSTCHFFTRYASRFTSSPSHNRSPRHRANHQSPLLLTVS